MNENINLLEILRTCLKGTKLYTPVYGVVRFCGIEDELICVQRVSRTIHFTKKGELPSYVDGFNDGECLLFPSKTQHDWSKFELPKKIDPFETFHKGDEVLVRLACTWQFDIFIDIDNVSGGANCKRYGKCKSMQQCIHFAEQFSGHIFDGDIENYFDCKEYLKSHWKNAVASSFLNGVIITPSYEDDWFD